jgi:hypothetical protein
MVNGRILGESKKAGYEADVALSHDVLYHGTVDKIFNVVDPETRTHRKARIKIT